MGRYTGPKARINRRLGVMLFENAGVIKSSERRDYPPGMAGSGRRKKTSTYGLALAEKQKIKYYFGLRDKHIRKYFDKARHMKGNTGEQLLMLCERRLDNIIRRAGFTSTRPQARQGITHAHFQVKGVTAKSPSIQLKVGDVITVRNRPNLKKLYAEYVEAGATQTLDWISFDAKDLTATVTALPSFEDVSLSVDVGQVVAFLSR